MRPTMGRRATLHILVALDLTRESGRGHLNGYYRYADAKKNWQTSLVPSTAEAYMPSVERIVARGIDGAIVKGECVGTVLRAIRNTNVPIVSIDRPRSDDAGETMALYVSSDNRSIGECAAKYFLSLGMFASYGFIPDPYDCEWSRRRAQAFRRALRTSVKNADIRESGADIGAFLEALPKPAAVFAAFDACAAEVLAACRAKSIAVPKDLIVLGVDDDPLVSNHTNPKLSSIRPDHEMQGYTAAKELDRLLGGLASRSRRTIEIPPLGITERDSTASVPPAVALVRRIMAYLDKYALEAVKVSDVVRHAGVSARLANLRFSAATGHSIQEELVLRRMKEVKRLLKTSNWTFKRIAGCCGFKSGAVLGHLFHSRFGISMRRWRQSECSKSALAKP